MGVNLRFAGEYSHEPLLLGEHVTVRLQKNYLGRLRSDSRVELTDMQTGQTAYGQVTDLVWDVTFADMGDIDWSLQRTHHQTSGELVETLQKMYPDSDPDTKFVVVAYTCYMAEVLNQKTLPGLG